MITKKERELEAKGYNSYGCNNFHNPDDAKAKAVALRKQGYYATVVESASNVIGYHEFIVYVKKEILIYLSILHNYISL